MVRKLDDQIEAKILGYHRAGWKRDTIARECSVSRTGVRGVLQRHGLYRPRKTYKEYKPMGIVLLQAMKKEREAHFYARATEPDYPHERSAMPRTYNARTLKPVV